MKKKSYPLSKVYGLLETGPVVLVSTAYKKRSNIMTMSWHTMLEFEPPLVGCVISNRNRTFDILRKTGECVINIPTVELTEKVVACGNTHGDKVDKFKTYTLTPRSARMVASPLIDECYANLECRVADRRMIRAYNLFILEVLKAWIKPTGNIPKTIHHHGRGNFSVAGKIIAFPSKMK
ncbi:MAG: flavin reductase family protein [Candidatus Omnitrophica bacterium]|nr:flavin reductase family protein [Candidatus Omnitrophota bacterium]